MADQVRVELDTRVLDRLAGPELTRGLQNIVEKTAYDVMHTGQDISEARVDTGAMMNAFCVSTSWGRTKAPYNEAAAIARQRRPKMKVAPEPPVRAKRGDFLAAVANLVEYFMYHEYGTAKMSALPMLRPALQKHKKGMENAVRLYLAKVAK